MPSSDDPKNLKQPLQKGGETNDLEGLGMDELLDMYDRKMSNFAEGDIIRGRVLKVIGSEVVVDIGYKSEGVLPVHEVTGFDGQITVKPGDELDVFIERLENNSGYIVLPGEKGNGMLFGAPIKAVFKPEEPISGRVVERVKG